MRTWKVVLRHRGDGSMLYTSYQAADEKQVKKLVRVAFTNTYMIARMVVQ